MGSKGKSSWKCQSCSYHNYDFRDVCNRTGCKGKRPTPSGSKQAEAGKGKDKTIADLQRQLKEKDKLLAAKADLPAKTAEGEAPSAESATPEAELAVAKATLASVKQLGGFGDVVTRCEGEIASLEKQIREAKPVPVRMRQLADKLKKKQAVVQKLEEETVPAARKQLEEAQAELAQRQQELADLKQQQAEVMQESVGPGFKDGLDRGQQLLRGIMEMAGQTEGSAGLRAVADNLQKELQRLQETAAVAEAQAAQTQAAQQQQHEQEQAAAMQVEQEQQVDDEVRAAADAAAAAATGGAPPEAHEAIRTAIKHAVDVATMAGNKKAKLGVGSSPGEQRP